jgi:hypothetical protein
VIPQKRWVNWNQVERVTKGGKVKWTKPPFQPARPHIAARSNNPATWGSYAEAVAAVRTSQAAGIGIMLLPGELAAADLDKCRDVESGEVCGWAARMCVEARELGLYVEVTVSGSGLRLIGLSHQGTELHKRFSFNRKTGEGLELYRATARFITVSGLQEGDCTVMGPIDSYLDLLNQRFGAGPPPTQQPPLTEGGMIDFNAAPLLRDADYFAELIENGAEVGERSERFAECIWHLANRGMTAEEIVEELSRHPGGIAAKYAKRLSAEVTRCFGKWQSRCRASVTGETQDAGYTIFDAGSTIFDAWPQIRVTPGELPRVVNEAEEALLLLGEEFFHRGGQLVRPVFTIDKTDKPEGWQLVPLERPYLVECLCRAGQFTTWKNKAWRIIDAPDKVAMTLLSRRGKWKLPELEGIVQTPFLRADGSLCEASGYDQASKLLFKTADIFPPVPQQPTRDDALVALERLESLIVSFPFIVEADRSVALAALLTGLDRRSMDFAPLFAFSSPAAGTGKSKLVNLCAILASGHELPVIGQGRSEEEFEKRLGAVLLAGSPIVSVDNCERELKSDFLCQALTQAKVGIRVLGYSTVVETPMNATLFATGNNLVISGDLTRRILMSRMDAGCERPELRVFASDAVTEAKRKRTELVIAALTVLRAWHVAGQRIELPPFGGFEDWSYRIREPLVWLDRADPCQTMTEVRESDSRRDDHIAVMEQWKMHFGVGHSCTVQQVIDSGWVHPEFLTALKGVAEARSGGTVSNNRLGWWLRRVNGKIVNGFKLEKDRILDGYPLWKLVQAVQA